MAKRHVLLFGDPGSVLASGGVPSIMDDKEIARRRQLAGEAPKFGQVLEVLGIANA